MAKIIIEIEKVEGPTFEQKGISMPIMAKISVKGKETKDDAVPLAVAHKLAQCYSESIALGISSAFKAVIIETIKDE
ncbi:hypothetical protein ABVY18_004147 [Vibrio parahaemolyticus]|nr:hypothetical protein [Vibrio parahaemolyticus]EGR3072926.1 hypothetical protein [Vibrio parahaemolyticus]EGR3174418.1 hypothetical protein [Vibrio parahaemolyticus]EJC6906642.1 hypothetical protein [Vibrio parahaemolyticus]EJC7022090.1 hypothetical protein [Vibrio parahaemolyticus]